MFSFPTLAALWCFFNFVNANFGVEVAEVAKREEVGSGCAWCSEGPWTTAAGMWTIEKVGCPEVLRS
jgi:hypothetical protein